jgi:hypothetical protein
MHRRLQRTQKDDEGVHYTAEEIYWMMLALRPHALQVAGQWANVDFPDTLLAIAEGNFLRLHMQRRFTNFKSFYLDFIRRQCRDEWLKQRSTPQRRTMAHTQAAKRELLAQEARGEITFAERKRLEQAIDDKNTEAEFYFDDRGRYVYVDMDEESVDVGSDVLHDLGLGHLSDAERWWMVRDELACIWSNLTAKEKQLLLQRYYHEKSVKALEKKFGSAVGVRLSKLIHDKMRKIVQDTQGKYYRVRKVNRAFKDKDFQKFLTALGYGDDDL